MPATRQTSRIAVLTGGPGCGKTTLLESLASSGVATIQEAALMLINEMNSRLGAEGQRTWRQEHFNEFQDLLIDRQLSLEASTDPSRWAVADRGLLDIVGFCRFKGVAPPPRLKELTRTSRYATAFVLEPLPQFEDRQRTGRLFNRDEAIAIGECLCHAYANAGVPIVAVPFMAVAERASLVTRGLSLADPAS